jgi:hypothetical protein
MKMGDENHFMLQFIQSQGRDFLEMKASTHPSTNPLGDEEDKDERKLMKQPIRGITGYRQKGAGGAIAAQKSQSLEVEKEEEVVAVPVEDLLSNKQKGEDKEDPSLEPKPKKKKAKRAPEEEVEEIVEMVPAGGESEGEADSESVGRLRAKTTKKGKKSIKKLRVHK